MLVYIVMFLYINNIYICYVLATYISPIPACATVLLLCRRIYTLVKENYAQIIIKKEDSRGGAATREVRGREK